MTRRCLCWARQNAVHAPSCPFPIFHRRTAEIVRWRVEYAARAARVRATFRPDPDALVVIRFIADRLMIEAVTAKV